MRSKRLALRFPGGNLPVSYKTAYDEGEARLQNVSTAGCALAQVSQALQTEEKILISVKLPGVDSIFQAQGKVVRVADEEHTAIRFTLIEPEDQTLVRNYFANSRGKINTLTASCSHLHSRNAPDRIPSEDMDA